MNEKTNKLIKRHLKIIEKQESTILNRNENTFIKTKINPLFDKIQDKIPNKLISLLDLAFYKGFQLVFNKGTQYIEKTYSKDKIQLEYDLKNYAVDKRFNSKHIKNLDKQSKFSKTFNSSFAVLEGGLLGLLGIGLPDIPLIIAIMMKTVYEIALSYGFEYETDDEKAYILYIICASLMKGPVQKDFDKMVQQLSEKLDSNISIDIDLDDVMHQAAHELSNALLTIKFIQGIPVVGIIGGIVNTILVRKVGKYASIKYKKRYLLNKLNKK